MALLVQTPRGTVTLPPQGFFQTQPSPFASQLTPRGIPFVPSQSRAPRLIPTAIAPPIPAPPAPVFAAPPLLAPVIRPEDGGGFDTDDFFSDPLTDDAPFGPGSAISITDTIGGLLGSVADFAEGKVADAIANPVPTAADFALGFAPVVGPINAISGFFGGPTVGKSLFGEDGLLGDPGPMPVTTAEPLSPNLEAYLATSFADKGVTSGPNVPIAAPSAPADEGVTSDGVDPGFSEGGIGGPPDQDDTSEDDGSGDGDGSFICTAAWNTGISNSQTWSSDKRMFAYIVKNDPDAYAGYKKIGPWIAKRVHRGKLLWMAHLFPRSWAYEIDQRQGKDTSKYPLWIKIENRLQRALVRPLFRLWGRA